MKYALINGKVITPYRVIEDSAVIVNNGKIEQIATGAVATDDCTVIDCQGYYVSPGFIDMHVHGGGGYDFMDGSTEAIIGAAKSHMMHGTTSICPTTLTCPDEDLFNFFDCFKEAKKAMTDGPNFAGIHLEGPYFSEAQKGAQDSKYILNPKPEHYLKVLNYCPDIVRISAAPELEGALELGKELKSRGIIAAVGHSDADYEDVLKAYECGYTHLTHFYSGMSTIYRKNAYRHLGVVEAGYLIDGLSIEVISDGCHLPKDLLKMIVKLKANDKISLITDSSRGSGLPDGTEIILGSKKYGQLSYVENGVAIMPDRKAFAGSVCTTDRCVRTMHKTVGLTIEESVAMMTANPAKVLGIDSKKGYLSTGYDADINVFDNNVNIKHVMVGGELRF